MAFRVGQKVVCVDDAEPTFHGVWAHYQVKGQIYTVTAVGLVNNLDRKKLPCILVAELNRNELSPLWEHRFRPIVERKTDISIFTKMLTDTKIGADA